MRFFSSDYQPKVVYLVPYNLTDSEQYFNDHQWLQYDKVNLDPMNQGSGYPLDCI
jgi:hypothetical protein